MVLITSLKRFALNHVSNERGYGMIRFFEAIE